MSPVANLLPAGESRFALAGVCRLGRFLYPLGARSSAERRAYSIAVARSTRASMVATAARAHSL